MPCSLPRATHTLLALVLFMFRVWSKPLEPTCDGRRRQGDKWFDGCHWCVCHPSGPVCSSTECSVLIKQLPPCDNLGSVWLDGCYLCRCQPQGIECSLDPACLDLLSSRRYEHDSPPHLLPLPHSLQGSKSHSSCLEPFDDRCVCGVDGVPACPAEVIDMSAYSTVTVELHPILPSTQDLESSDRVFPSSSLHEQFKAPSDYTSFPKDLSGQRPLLQVNLTKSLLQKIDNALPATDKSDPNVLTEQNNSSVKETTRTRLRPAENKVNPLQSEPSVQIVKSDLDNQESYKVIVSLTEQDVTSSRQQGSSLGSKQGSVPTSSSSPSLLVVSLNRCRWGARWYGGSLRCYCGHDNTVTCGDPSFVAPRIDGFRLEKGACVEGQTWDYDSCTVCQCRISGIALCRRAPSCPLPFLIKPAWNAPDRIDDVERTLLDQWGGQQEFAHKDNTLDWHETTVLDMTTLPPNTHEIIFPTTYLSTPSLDTTKAADVNSTPSGVTEHVEIIQIDDIDGSGEVKLQDELTNQLNTAYTDVRDVSIEANTTPTAASGPTTKAELTTPAKDSSTSVVTNNSTLVETSAGPNRDLNTSPRPPTWAAPVKECKPKSRWLDGCRRCTCDEVGSAHCDNSRCPKVPPPKPATPTPDQPNKPYVRPVQKPPPDSYLDNRDHPVKPEMYRPDSCGPFQPGQIFWDDCNVCLCTTIGPKCTAKNCT